MTQKEKLESLKGPITQLYSIEGKSKTYIAKLFEVQRKDLTDKIIEWQLEQAQKRHINPSTQKWINSHKAHVIAQFNKDICESFIADDLGMGRDKLRYYIELDESMLKARQEYLIRCHNKAQQAKIKKMQSSKYNYESENPITGEIWKPILGHEGYFVSDKGRVKKYIKRYDDYLLFTPTPNARNGRLYVKIEDKNLQLARLVGIAFVNGQSELNNTIDHIDGNIANNEASNLRWVSQADNNKAAYDRGRTTNVAFTTRKKFKKIVLDESYEFKTITALAKFLGVSWTQCNRYITGECVFNRKISFIY